MATLTGSIAIGYLNHASGGTITATTSATGYPASNLSNSRLSSSHRTTTGSLTSQNIDVDLASSRDIDVISLIGTNLSDSATRSPVTSEASDYTSPEYNPGSGNVFDLTYPGLVSDTPRYGRNLIVLPGSTLNSRYVRLTLNNSGNVDNFLSSRVYWAGPLWQPAISFAVQGEPYRKRRVLVGSPGIERYLTCLEIDLHVLTEAEGRALESICSARLRTGRLLVIPRPTQPATWLSEAIYCTLDPDVPEAISLTAWPQGGSVLLWKVTLKFKEVED
jgi:hypothetical protein